MLPPLQSPQRREQPETKDWQFIAYNKRGKEIKRLSMRLEDRTEHEASSEGMKIAEQFREIDDWSIIPV